MKIKKKIIFVIGGPGSGKGTLCQKLKEELNYEHINTGNILRNIVKNKSHPKWDELKTQLADGQLVPSKDYFSFLKNEILISNKEKILIDGFPRSNENIEIWEMNMKEEVQLKAVLFLKCSNEKMLERVLGRNEGRSDDNKETIIKRIENFNRYTSKIIDYYKKQGILITFDANKEKNELYNDAVTFLNKI